jgi:glycosyltransferase involved in cell wall biosynthesis
MQPYFDEKIKPYLGEQIEYLGMIPRTEQVAHFQNALALVMPIQWEEPFGLVVIESMACGTPVISWNRGSMPEIIDNGVNGYIVNSFDEFVAKVGEIEKISRSEVRKHVEEKFSLGSMVHNYKKVYEQVLSGD